MSEIDSSPERVIQCKVCLVGTFAVGKTSLVRRFVHSMFSDRYLTTVGVRVDRRDVTVGNATVRMLIWDLAGEDPMQPLFESYLRGAGACVLVGDLTRAETIERLSEHRAACERVVPEASIAVLFNKADLGDDRETDDAAIRAASVSTIHAAESSAKTGAGVAPCFEAIAHEIAHRTAGGGTPDG